MPFPTLTDLTYELALALDDGLLLVSGPGGTTSTVVIGSLISLDPHASPNAYDNVWIFNRTQTLQRLVRPGAYVPGSGTLTVDPSWPPGPAVNDLIVLTELFPCIEDIRQQVSYRTLIDNALARIVMPDELSLPIVPGQQVYPLTTWATWLDTAERVGWGTGADGSVIGRMREPGPFPGLAQVPSDWRRPRLMLDSNQPRLEIDAPFAPGTTGVLTLSVLRPANTWLARSGVWTETDHMDFPTDQTRIASADVVDVALEEAFLILWQRGAHTVAGTWRDKYLAQQPVAQAVIDRIAGRRSQPAAPPAAGAA